MNIFSNSTIQFIITSSITLLLGGINLWLLLRRRVQIPLTYETLLQQRVDPSNEEVRDLLAKIHISPDDSRVQYLSFVTFKLWNSGKESVTILSDDKPVILSFPPGATILACEEIAREPQELEYTWRLEDEKILLAFPLLDSNDVITIRVLLTGRIDYFPDISVRVPGSKRIVRANNIQQSKELFITALFMLCITTYLFVSTWSLSPYPFSVEIWVVFYGGAILLLITSWLIRTSPPGFPQPSKGLWEIIQAMPIAIPFCILGVLIYHWFGKQTFFIVITIICYLFIILGLWFIPYTVVTAYLKKKKKKYNAVLVGVLATIPSLLFLALCLRVFFLYFW